jgi:glycosyltransferase involved in cell wall biosynthesis
MSFLRIMHIIPNLNRGGAERLVVDICRCIHKNELANIILVALNEQNQYTELTKDIPLRVCNSDVIPSISGKATVNIQALEDLIHDFKPQIIHSHLFKAEITSRHKIHTEIKYVTHLHDNMYQFESLEWSDLFSKRKISNAYEKRILLKQYRICKNNFIAISGDTKKFFLRNLPSNMHRIKLMSNAIDFSRFSYTQCRIPSHKEISMISIGSLVDKKNHLFLCDVVFALLRKGYFPKLHILGEGKNRKKIEDRIDELKLHNYIFLHGNVANVEKFLSDVSFYVHPATYEPFGLVLLEAMAASAVCVSLNGRGNLDIHREGQNGFLIDPPDANRFAEKLIELSENPDFFSSVANYSHDFASKYDILNYCKNLIEYYKSLLTGH